MSYVGIVSEGRTSHQKRERRIRSFEGGVDGSNDYHKAVYLIFDDQLEVVEMGSCR
jgi:hypothetical protein